MKIEEKQNQEAFLTLLYAQRYYYNKARMPLRFRAIINILLPVSSVISILWFPSLKMPLAIFGAVWLIISQLILQERAKHFTKLAATIQEEFDTRLFDIKWNKVLIGEKVKPDIIFDAVSNFRKGRDKLRDWYTGLNCDSLYLNTLLAQRTNLIWDQNLRKRYATFLFRITWSAFIFLIILGIIWKMSVEDLLLTIVIPSLSAFVYGIQNARSHKQHAIKSKKTESYITASFEQSRNHSDHNNFQLLREYQNQIFLKRSEPLIIPKWYYWIHQKKDNEKMKKVNEFMQQL
ncbi:S-4TM family putative pore-forming effector [Brevibacillus laterosporus]|uniref:S-4TM family putative pore-forming effector n=1 Tax=Brevibacillus halotolerans TaxID=1507437 RepID=A0ABT4HZG2_9BACL|nr:MULTISPECIES: S-4TM family putative pore-forming effector [Brevibacillus]MCR8985986.1 S-4TM family putative pore-forming effector [Brevibacillus laterosporus]MCZ0831719.1 S-4TM family putative pore-forming effector [Brevibacillus halotolerans]